MAGVRKNALRNLVPWTLLGFVLITGVSLTSSLQRPPDEIRAGAPLLTHDPILIDGDGDFTAANGVTDGNGTSSNPYTIEGWEIDASSGLPSDRPFTFRAGIVVNNTTSPFILRHVTVFGAPVTGLVLHNVQDVRMEDVTVTQNPTGLEIFAATNVTIVQSRIINNDIGGVLMGFSTRVRFQGNTLSGNGVTGPYSDYALHDSESEDFNFEENLVTDNGRDGLLFRNTNALMVRNNTISGHIVPFAIGVIFDQTDPELIDNVIVANDVGVKSFVGSGTISGNRISGNRIGIWLAGSFDLQVQANRIEANGECGLNLTQGHTVVAISPASNRIVHNEFTANGAHVCGGFFEDNAWDAGYPGGGNSWSGYEGSDFCSGPNQDVCPDPDGIGDAPFTVDGVILDRYPLVEIGTGERPPFPLGTALAIGIPAVGLSVVILLDLIRRRRRDS